jgi:cytidylate kinase
MGSGRRRPLRPLIAIDGPAGAGKSTVSKAVAERLGLDRLDTGAMYRAVAWEVLHRGIAPDDAPAVAEVAAEAAIEVGPTVRINGADVTKQIRTAEVSRVVSAVAANPAVRHQMVRRQRDWADGRSGAVVEGRDIGSVVFPEATVKIYLTATHEERARRRGEDETADGVALRDQLDSSRSASPLTAAPDAHILDTTGRSVEDVVEEVLSWL